MSGPVHPSLRFAAAALGLVAMAVLALCVGRYPVAPLDALASVAAWLGGRPSGLPPTIDQVVLSVRGPRVAAAVLIGAALSASGAAFQAVFRNPLVAPDILGVSAGAALGAVLGIFLHRDPLTIQLSAFAGGLLAVALVYGIAARLRQYDPTLVLVLAGVVIGALLSACVSMLKVLADPFNQLPAITFWMLGSLASAAPADAWALLPATAAGLLVLGLLRWRLDVLSLGDEDARALGVDVRWIRVAAIAAATVMTAASVAVAGVVGWIGLLIPHVARLLVGPSFGRLLPASVLLGGAFLCGVDTLARSAASVELPLGVLTAVAGTPLFVWVLARARTGWQ